MKNISLICLAGPLKGQVFRLNGGPVHIFGRYSKATFSMSADPAISHLHFLIDTSDNRVRVVDLGSTNGLVVNAHHIGGRQGQPVSEFVPLKSGDTILAGASLFRLSVVDETTITGLSSLTDPRKAFDIAAVEEDGAPGNLTTVISKGLMEDRMKAQQNTDGKDTDATVEVHEKLPEIDGYTLLAKIGGGGKGVVYKAIKDDTGACAAIKIMIFNRNKSKKQRSIEMFRREIQMTRQLQHPHIIRYIGDGIFSGSPYLAIEYVEGGNLDELLRICPNGLLELPQAVPLFIQLLEAVAYMHSRSLVHRDIKPKNVLLDIRRGGSLAVKLSDMGLSCRFSTQDVGEFLPIVSEGGTPAYMPPEQLTDLTRAIPQSDVFSSAATLYHMLTGTLLYNFTDRDQNETILEGNIVPIAKLRPDIPTELVAVMEKALSYAPENRYVNAQEMLDAFKKALAR